MDRSQLSSNRDVGATAQLDDELINMLNAEDTNLQQRFKNEANLRGIITMANS